MKRLFRLAPALLGRACLGLGAAAVAVGCHHACTDGDCKPKHGHGHHGPGGFLNIDNCSDIPQGAIPQPIGTYVNLYLDRQSGKAEADDFTLYYNEFLEDQAVLGPFGGQHLARIIHRLPFVPFPIVIQPDPDQPDPSLTLRRQQAVIDALVQAGIPDAARRVVIAQPRAEGMPGSEAAVIGGLPNTNPGVGFSGFGGVSGFAGGFTGFGFGGFGR